MTSYLRTAILLAGLTALFGVIGFAIGGKSGMMIALLVAFGMNVFAWWNSADMVLTMYGAQEVDADAAPPFYGLVQQLAQRAGLPMPRVYIIHDAQPNAFATGRNPEHAAVAATTGLLESLSREELAGVIAHELAHVKNRDTLIMTITATIAGAISMIANVGLLFGGGRDERDNPLGIMGTILMMILAPIAATVVQMAISRTREYEADRLGADICRQPLWLAGALERIDAMVHAIPSPAADAHPATAHLFIINPLHGSSLASLFSTHPSTEERVRRLQQMAGVGAGASARGPWG